MEPPYRGVQLAIVQEYSIPLRPPNPKILPTSENCRSTRKGGPNVRRERTVVSVSCDS